MYHPKQRNNLHHSEVVPDVSPVTDSNVRTADRLAQLVECRTTVREVAGSVQTLAGPTLRVFK